MPVRLWRFCSRVVVLAGLVAAAALSTASMEPAPLPVVALAAETEPPVRETPVRGLAATLCPLRDDRSPGGTINVFTPRDDDLWGRPWIDSEVDAVSDDVNVHMRIEGRPACDGSPRVRYSAHLTVTNRGPRTGWFPTSVCGGQGICHTPGLDLEVQGGGRRSLSGGLGRHLYQSLAKLRPGESTELDVQLFTCADLGPPASLRLGYDLSGMERAGTWRSLSDASSGTRVPKGARLLFESVSAATAVRCLDPR